MAASDIYQDYYPGKFEDKKYNSVNLYGDYYPGKYIYKSQGGSLPDPQKPAAPNPEPDNSDLEPYTPIAPPVSPYNDLIAQLERARAERERRIAEAKQNQLSQANLSYNDLEQQAYIQKLQALQNHPTQMALTGQTGGLSETAALAPQLSYGNALSAYGRDRANRIAQINAAFDEQALGTADAYDQQIYSVRAAAAQQNYENQLAAQQLQNDAAIKAYQAALAAQAKYKKNGLADLETITAAERINAAKNLLAILGNATEGYQMQYLYERGYNWDEIAAVMNLS